MCESEMFLYLAFFLTSAAFAPAPGAKEHGIRFREGIHNGRVPDEVSAVLPLEEGTLGLSHLDATHHSHIRIRGSHIMGVL